MENPSKVSKVELPTYAEQLALGIANGHDDSILEMKIALYANDQMKFAPVLFVLKQLWRRQGELPKVGKFAFDMLNDPLCVCKGNSYLTGNLIGIIALHLPSHLAVAVQYAFPQTSSALTVFEAILAVHSVLK